MERRQSAPVSKAGIAGLVLVFLLMCFLYLLPGLASSLALVIYTGLVLVILNAFDITLTLPGHCRYYSWYWYGSRRQCYHLRP